MKTQFCWIFCLIIYAQVWGYSLAKWRILSFFFHLTCHSRTSTGADNTIRPMVASDGPTWGAADNGGTDLKIVSSCLVASAHHPFAALLLILGLLLAIALTWLLLVGVGVEVCYLYDHENRTGLFFSLIKWLQWNRLNCSNAKIWAVIEEEFQGRPLNFSKLKFKYYQIIKCHNCVNS